MSDGKDGLSNTRERVTSEHDQLGNAFVRRCGEEIYPISEAGTGMGMGMARYG